MSIVRQKRIAVGSWPRMISGGPRIGIYRSFNLRDHHLRGSTAVLNQYSWPRSVPITVQQIAIQPHFIAAALADYMIAVVVRFAGTLVDDPRMNRHHAFPAISGCGVHLHDGLTGVTLRIEFQSGGIRPRAGTAAAFTIQLAAARGLHQAGRQRQQHHGKKKRVETLSVETSTAFFE